jgi:hypothetical protein
MLPDSIEKGIAIQLLTELVRAVGKMPTAAGNMPALPSTRDACAP